MASVRKKPYSSWNRVCPFDANTGAMKIAQLLIGFAETMRPMRLRMHGTSPDLINGGAVKLARKRYASTIGETP